MKRYIDADRLRAEIEKRKQIHFNDYFVKKSGNPADYGASNALAQVLTLIDYLRQDEKAGERWQPCDEHFRALGYAIEYFKKKKNDTTHLEDLYNGLKKLS